MANDRYLIVSYFLFGFMSLALGWAAYRVLRKPFATIAEAVTSCLRGAILKRTLALSIIMASVLGFLSANYRDCGMTYEQIVKDRSYLEQMNRRQLQHAGDWIAFVVLAWAFVVVILVAVWHKKRDEQNRANPRDGTASQP